VDGEWVFVSGTTGFDYETGEIPEDAAAQAEQTFRNIRAALEAANATIDDVVRVQYTLTDASHFEPCMPVFAKWFDKARPAATAVIAGLIDPRMKIEIEVTARRST
jgi:enamine deaminase RidA (YjgF/YER057c/UK114 family)